ncbi:MAG: NAD(P)H-hydrate dehydratase [Deltaproteobacteria bacterium]
MKVSQVSEMRALDRAAIEQFGIEEELLMENAGEATYFVILTRFGVKNKRFAIFCGAGNNGGDGFVIARKLHSNGARVAVFLMGGRDKYKGAAKLNLNIISGFPIPVREVRSPEEVRADVLHSDAIIDAILGTGLEREVKGHYRDIIKFINETGKIVFSADIPSGVNGNTGQVMGIGVKADYTVTYGLPKVGNILYPGFELCGEQYVTHISFPPELIETQDLKVAVSSPEMLPPRDPNAHKGSVGQVLFIAGASSYFGAPLFSALSFLKAGGGYARLAAPAAMTPFIASMGSEIVLLPQEETESGSISLENKASLLEIAAKMDMVVLGPGLSLNAQTSRLVRALTREIDRPLLIDGDGITAVSGDVDILKARGHDTILTPHPGEMSRLTGMAVGEIVSNRIQCLQETSRKLNSVIVLKGAHSLIGYPDGRVLVNMSGNAGMATAGSGDVLTGTIAAMFGLGLNLEEAVAKGVFIHGLSGDLAAEAMGQDGITARDILAHLSFALKMDREGTDASLRHRYCPIRVI